MPPQPVAVCGLCLVPADREGLVQCAAEGSLLSVCRRCFLLKQIGELSAGLPQDDAAVAAVEDGLRTLYDLVRSRAEEVILERFRDAAQAQRSQSEGRSGSEGR